jgi:hypothetical protein
MRCQVLFLFVLFLFVAFSRPSFYRLRGSAKDQRNRDDRKKSTQDNDRRCEIRILTKFFCEFSVALQGCEENEAQGFTQLDDRSKVVSIDEAISPSEIAPAKQSKKRQI